MAVTIFRGLLTRRWGYILTNMPRLLLCRGRVQSVPIRLPYLSQDFFNLHFETQNAVYRIVKGCVMRSGIFI